MFNEMTFPTLEVLLMLVKKRKTDIKTPLESKN